MMIISLILNLDIHISRYMLHYIWHWSILQKRYLMSFANTFVIPLCTFVYLLMRKGRQPVMYQIYLSQNFSILSKFSFQSFFCFGSNDIQPDTLSFFVIIFWYLLCHLHISSQEISKVFRCSKRNEISRWFL